MLTNSEYYKFDFPLYTYTTVYNSPDAPEIDDNFFGDILTPQTIHTVDVIKTNNNIRMVGDGKFHFTMDCTISDDSDEDFPSRLLFVVNNENIEYEHVISGATNSFEFDIDFKQNDILNIYIKPGYYLDGNYKGATCHIYELTIDITYRYPNLIDKKDNIISLNNYLPDITQAEFFKSIIKLFNLYIDTDKENDNNLIIEPRKQYFGSGKVVDWTNKFDNTSSLVSDSGMSIYKLCDI
jgi:hypothetical protein